MLRAITCDFVGKEATKVAMEAVVKHKMKAVQSILDMGGVLDEEEEEELKDTSLLSFEELEAFSDALQGAGSLVEEAEEDAGETDGANVLR
jgi:hypothetical protein